MNESQAYRSSGPSLKLAVFLVFLVFVLALAFSIARHLNTQAMAILIGIACGVAASVPTTALVVFLFLRRQQPKEEDPARPSRPNAYPPIVVIQGGNPQSLPFPSQAGYWPATPPGPPVERHFHVVGGDELMPGE